MADNLSGEALEGSFDSDTLYTVSESKLHKFSSKSLTISRFTFDKRPKTIINRENLFFASFLEVSSGICVHILRCRNKFLPFAL